MGAWPISPERRGGPGGQGRVWEVGHGGMARAPWKQGAAETHRGLELGAVGLAQLARRGAVWRDPAGRLWCLLWLSSWSAYWGTSQQGPLSPPATLPLLSAFPGLGIPVQSGSYRKQSQAASRLPTLEGNVGDLGLPSLSPCPRSQALGGGGELRIWAGMRWGSQGQDERGLI